MSIDRSLSTPRRGVQRAAIAGGLALLAAVLAVLVVGLREGPPEAHPALRLTWPLPQGAAIRAEPEHPFGLALSPDGRFVVVTAGASSEPAPLLLHELATGTTTALPGTAGGHYPFWAPDGTRLAFFADGALHRLALDGAAPVRLADAPAPAGGVWARDDTIVFAPRIDGGLAHVPASGGDLQELTTPDTDRGDTSHRFPQLAGNERVIVLFVTSTDGAREGVWAYARENGEMTRLMASAAHALALDAYVLVLRDQALIVDRLNPRTRRLEGRATFLSLPVGHGPGGELFASISATGLLVTAPPASTMRELRWFTRDGVPAGRLGDPAPSWGVRIAPDGRQVSLVQPEPMLGTLDVWVFDPGTPHLRRLSPSIDADEHPVWSPDGVRIAWINARQSIVVRGALGELDEDVVWRSPAPKRLSQWTDDGRWLVFSKRSATTREDLWLLPAGGGAPVAYLQTPFDEHSGAVSPDGRWLAYASDESGVLEVYLDRFIVPDPETPGPELETSGRIQVTTSGGTEPRWRADGHELFVRRGREILAVTLAPGDTGILVLGTERVVEAPGDVRAWDVSRDGRRLLLNLPSPRPSSGPPRMVVHWESLLR